MFMSFAGDGIIRTKKGEKAFVRKRSTRSSSPSTAPPAPAAKPVIIKKPESTPPGPPVIAPWTEAEDDILRDMKATNKSWKIIGDHLQGRDVWTMKQRWKELNAAKTSETNEEKKEDSKADEKKGDKKNDEKEEKKDDKKDEKKEDPPIKSALKTTKTETKAETVPKKVGDQPIIHVDKDDQCSPEDYTLLYKLHGKAETDKWVEIASRFFDKTGRRIDTQYLKEKLANC